MGISDQMYKHKEDPHHSKMSVEGIWYVNAHVQAQVPYLVVVSLFVSF